MLKTILLIAFVASVSAAPYGYEQQQAMAAPQPQQYAQYEAKPVYRMPNPEPLGPEPFQMPLPFGPEMVPPPPVLPIPFVRPHLPLLPFWPVNPLPTPLPTLFPPTSDALLLFDSGFARANMPIMPMRNVFMTPSFNIAPFHNPFLNPNVIG